MDLNSTGANEFVESYGSDKAYSPGSVNVTSEEQVQDAIQNGLCHFKNNDEGLNLTGAVICSGIVWPPQSIKGYGLKNQLTSYSQFKHVVTINLLGTYNVAQQVAQAIMDNKDDKPLNEDGNNNNNNSIPYYCNVQMN